MLRACSTGVLVVALSIGCANAASGGDVAIESAASKYCAALQGCQPIGFSLEFGSIDACATAQSTSLQAVAALPGVTVTTTQLASCLTAAAAAGCDSIEGTAPMLVACAFANGTESSGSACTSDLQCFTGNCSGTSALSCGTCRAEPNPIASGLPCANAKECASLHCVNHVCVDIGTSGGACGTTAVCAHGLRCAAGTCASFATNGAACASNADCDAEGSSYCSAAGVCATYTVTVTSAGGSCGGPASSTNVFTECGPGAHCIVNACVADAQAGGSCDTQKGPLCMAGLACFQGSCVTTPTCN
jgi:hypothetical protein